MGAVLLKDDSIENVGLREMARKKAELVVFVSLCDLNLFFLFCINWEHVHFKVKCRAITK